MRYGFLIDHHACIGCHACTVACKAEHNVPVGEFRTWVKYIEEGEFPNSRRRFAVLRCNHCTDAPCIPICPVTALFKRDNGIVDFDGERCIGCKSCMLACPYDALYIHPELGTAQKCNYCAHKVEMNLEPACVTVCPTQAIVAGDLDDPTTAIARRVAKEETMRRKLEDGTGPNVYYAGGAEGALDPQASTHPPTYMWSNVPDESVVAGLGMQRTDGPKTVYDIKHPAPWGWRIAAYLWTKALSAGAVLIPAALGTMDQRYAMIAMVMLAVTMVLLVTDLRKPSRFLYIMLKPQWKSWLVLGGYVLAAYGGLLGLYLIFPHRLLVWPTALLAAGASLYSVFLFRQARARRFWQGWSFPVHLTLETVLAGLCIVGLVQWNDAYNMPIKILLAASAVVILAEGMTPHADPHVDRAATNLVRMPALWFYAILMGHLLPAFLLTLYGDNTQVPLVLALVGQLAYNRCWVRAGQSVPLS